VSAGTARSDVKGEESEGTHTFKPLSRRRRRKPFHGLAVDNAISRLGAKSCEFSGVMTVGAHTKTGRRRAGASQSKPTARKAKELVFVTGIEKEALSWPRRGQR
jgi:hypothetical protein